MQLILYVVTNIKHLCSNQSKWLLTVVKQSLFACKFFMTYVGLRSWYSQPGLIADPYVFADPV